MSKADREGALLCRFLLAGGVFSPGEQASRTGDSADLPDMMKLQGLARDHCACQVICQGSAGAPTCVNLFDVYSGGCWTIAACSGEPQYPDLGLKVLRSFFPNTDKNFL